MRSIHVAVATALAITLLSCVGVTPSSAQPALEVVFTSPPSPVGAGARATGVGSAFIAVADDATAASWNPSGLTQLERPELSVVGRSEYTIDDLGSGTENSSAGGIDQTISASGSDDSYVATSLDYLSAAFPFSIDGHDAVASINYQQMFSFKSDLHLRKRNISEVLEGDATQHVRQSGGLDAITGALAVEPTPGLSLGFAVNFWIDGLGRSYAWRQAYDQTTALTFPGVPPIEMSSTQHFTYDHFRGTNATLGVLWKASSQLSLGAVAKLPFTAHSTFRIRFVDPAAEDFRERLRFRMPLSVGAGAAYRPVDQLTLSADLTYVYWDQFRVADSSGGEFLLNGDPEAAMSVEGVLTERMGAEYLWTFSDVTVAGRAGIFFDPEPSAGHPRAMVGGSAGLGFTWKQLSLDFAYQARVGLDVRRTLVATELLDLPSAPDDRIQNLFYLSVVHYF